MRVVEIGDAVSDLVDVVPPRAGDGHVLVQWDEREPTFGDPESGQCRGGISLLAMARVVPQLEYRSLKRAETDGWLRLGDRASKPADLGHADAQVGPRRLHVGLHRRCP